jgi:hypothetical protein
VLHDRVDGRLVVGGLLILGSLAVVPVTTLVTGDNPATSEPGDTSRVYHLDKGDCFDAGPALERHGEVTVVDCDDPHDSVVVRVEDFSTYGSEGDEARREADDEAADECRDALEEYVDSLAAGNDVESRLYLDPGHDPLKDRALDETEWTVACVAWSPTGRF